ncbi:MAG: PD-(D/E)XK nuclease family transposase [Bacteroidia bacterium]|nr:PD-(D/E)XK nuclease family transposase [Bacteroidia bacterium]
MEKKEKYINPFTDYGFKRLFGEELHKDLLIDFLNEVLNGKEKIKNLTYLKTSKLGSTYSARKAVFDLYCENEKGEKFIVEMQKAEQEFFKDRSIFYSTFPIREQAIKGKWNFELKSVYTIGILDFVFDDTKKNEEYFHWEVKLMDTKHKAVFFDKLTYIYLELPKFTKTIDQIETRFEKWLYILKNLPKLDRLPEKLKEKIFQKVFKIAEIAKFSQVQLMKYEDSLKEYRDIFSVMETQRKKGIKEGVEKGKMEERKKQYQEKIQLARLMISQKETITKIIKYTGLSKQQIVKLK